jgi:hypothetical protein
MRVSASACLISLNKGVLPVPNTEMPMPSSAVSSGVPNVDAYLKSGFATVPGMSSRFAAAICAGLMRIQTGLGVKGPIAEIGTFEGRFFIALAKALQPGEIALGMDIFEWPNLEVINRFEANCLKHGVAADKRNVIAARSALPRCSSISAASARAFSISTVTTAAPR